MASRSNKVLFIGLGVAACLVGGCLLYKFSASKSLPKPIADKELLIPEINNKKLQPIVRELHRQLIDSPLSGQPEMLKKMYRRSIELILSQYNELVIQQRIRRRKLMKDRVKYIKEITKEEDQKKQLKEKSLNAILAQINMSQDSWYQEVLIWTSESQSNQEDWSELIIEMQDCLLEQFELKRKKVPIDSILQTHIKCLKSLDVKHSDFNEVLPDDLSILVNIMVNDEIYQQHGFQNQDIAAAIADLKEEDRKKLEKYFDEIDELISNLFESTEEG